MAISCILSRLFLDKPYVVRNDDAQITSRHETYEEAVEAVGFEPANDDDVVILYRPKT